MHYTHPNAQKHIIVERYMKLGIPKGLKPYINMIIRSHVTDYRESHCITHLSTIFLIRKRPLYLCRDGTINQTLALAYTL